MNPMIPSPFLKNPPTRSARDEILVDYRERRVLDAQNLAERKRLDLAEQCSVQNSVEMRVRAWETVHHLRMPSTPAHPVLEAIAVATQLTLMQVQEEQHRRCERQPSAHFPTRS